jgi:hypothetical protein
VLGKTPPVGSLPAPVQAALATRFSFNLYCFDPCSYPEINNESFAAFFQVTFPLSFLIKATKASSSKIFVGKEPTSLLQAQKIEQNRKIISAKYLR